MRKHFGIMIMTACLLLGSRTQTFASVQTGNTTVAAVLSEAAVKPDGWDGQRYYQDGKKLTGLQTIKGKTFYFSKKGVLQTGWKKISGKRYYFRESGKTGVVGAAYPEGMKTILGKKYYFTQEGYAKTGWMTWKDKEYYFGKDGAAMTGSQKINGKWYCFGKKGNRITKTTKTDSTTWYLNSGKYLEAYEKNGSFYKPDGTKMSVREKETYQTLQTARNIVAQITKPSMSDAVKLRTCFNWVLKKPYIVYRKFDVKSNWTSLYANDHFLRRGGDCHADASAFAFLARALGYKNVYVCLDCDGTRAQGHAWTEINGKVYDPLFAQAKNFNNNYNANYGVYKLSPILHLTVAAEYE